MRDMAYAEQQTLIPQDEVEHESNVDVPAT